MADSEIGEYMNQETMAKRAVLAQAFKLFHEKLRTGEMSDGTAFDGTNILFAYFFKEYLLYCFHLDYKTATLYFKQLLTDTTINAINPTYHRLTRGSHSKHLGQHLRNYDVFATKMLEEDPDYFQDHRNNEHRIFYLVCNILSRAKSEGELIKRVDDAVCAIRDCPPATAHARMDILREEGYIRGRLLSLVDERYKATLQNSGNKLNVHCNNPERLIATNEAFLHLANTGRYFWIRKNDIKSDEFPVPKYSVGDM